MTNQSDLAEAMRMHADWRDYICNRYGDDHDEFAARYWRRYARWVEQLADDDPLVCQMHTGIDWEHGIGEDAKSSIDYQFRHLTREHEAGLDFPSYFDPREELGKLIQETSDEVAEYNT